MTVGEQESSGRQHLATVSFGGRFWETYLEFDDDPRRIDSYRAFLSFTQADDPKADPVRTTVLIIENSYDDAVKRAKSFSEHQLASLLRSAKPD